MNISIEKQPQCKALLTVTIPKENVDVAREKIVGEFIRQTKVPGFRPGKTPRSVVEKRYADNIRAALQEELARDSLRSAIEQEKLRIIAVGETKDSPQADGSLAVSFELTMAPEFDLPEYKGLQITVPKISVPDKLIDKVIEERREQFATQKDVEGRPCQMGDFVVVDYKGKIDGQDMKELIEESEHFLAENHGFLLKLDSNNFLPGFCDQVAGANVGESRIVVAKIPEQLNTAVAGKDAVYEVTLRAVKEPVLPEVDDALADRISPGKNLEQLRADLRTRLEDMALEREKEARVEAAKQALLSLVEFDLPETIVNQTAQRRVNQLVNANLERGVDQQTLMANEQAILQTATERAKLDVKEEFLLAEISKREGFKVSDQELSLRVSQIAATARTSPKNVMKVMQKEDPDAMDNLRYSMRLDKARQFLADNAQVTEKAVNMGDEPGAEQE